MPESTLRAVSEELIELAASGHTAPRSARAIPKLDADAGYRAMRRAAPAPPGDRLEAARPQDRLHQPHDLAALRRARADLGLRLRPHADPRRASDRAAGPAARASRSRASSRRSASASRRRRRARTTRTPSSRPSTGWRTRSRSCRRSTRAGSSRCPTAPPPTACTGAWCSGRQVPVARLPDLESRACRRSRWRCARQARPVERGIGANVLDSPLFALAHLVEVLAIQPEFEQLHAGEIVSTGTLTDAHPVRAGRDLEHRLRRPAAARPGPSRFK